MAKKYSAVSYKMIEDYILNLNTYPITVIADYINILSNFPSKSDDNYMDILQNYQKSIKF